MRPIPVRRARLGGGVVSPKSPQMRADNHQFDPWVPFLMSFTPAVTPTHRSTTADMPLPALSRKEPSGLTAIVRIFCVNPSLSDGPHQGP